MWADLSVSDTSLDRPGYQLFRQDCGQHKAGGGLCIHTKTTSRLLGLRIYHLSATMAFNNFGYEFNAESTNRFLAATHIDLHEISTIAIWKVIKNCLPKRSKSGPIIPVNLVSLATSAGSSAAH